MPRKILAPHKEQDGWVYWRLKTTTGKNAANAPTINPLWLVKKDTLECVKASDIGLGVGYSDDSPGSRIISSRRTEEAVETADFLALCLKEGLVAERNSAGWMVTLESDPEQRCVAWGDTLREAYYRYKAEAELDAQQPGPFGDETKPPHIESESAEGRYCIDCKYIDTFGYEEPCFSCISAEYDDTGDWSRPNFVRAAL